MFNQKISPELLSAALGQKHRPTDQQSEVIGAPPSSLLVVAGAGAGKTETMAARVVWLVANGFARPDQVLGLTFTRKAAQELSMRIRARLGSLAGIDAKLRDLDPSGGLKESLQAIAPTVQTYDAFAGDIVREFGLLLPVETDARLITETEVYQIAWDVVQQYPQAIEGNESRPEHVTETLAALANEMDGHMVSAEDVREESEPFIHLFDELPEGKKKLDTKSLGYRDRQRTRLGYLPLVERFLQELKLRGVATFGQQMSKAALLAQRHRSVSEAFCGRFKVVMLDEYQDTSHAQRILLRSLFGGTDSVAVTAVGDPMQAIYGWRGATAANLEHFRGDFPHQGQPAEKRELTKSWRNPARVLELANEVSREVLGPPEAPTRPVQPLEPGEDAGPGQTHLGWFGNPSEERAWVADFLAAKYREEPDFTGAVLVRAKKHAEPMAAELRKLGVPVEVIGLGGLITVPEVADMIAVATMLIRPSDSQAALRVVMGPYMNLGLADVRALARRAKNLSGRGAKRGTSGDGAGAPGLTAPQGSGVIEEPAAPPRTAEDRMREEIAEALDEDAGLAAGLADAIADPGERNKYSPEGYRRIARLSGELRRLRTRNLAQGLPDLFSAIEGVLGLRTEVLARQDPRADGAVGTVHLDRFAEVVASFSEVPGASLASFLDYLRQAGNVESGLTPGEVQVRANRVQILTVHKAKGLEWDNVCVLHADNQNYTDANTSYLKVESWLSQLTRIPSSLRGDARAEGDAVGSPVLNLEEISDTGELREALEHHKQEWRASQEEESSRLFYVAITRARKALAVTGAAVLKGTKPVPPNAHFARLRELQPDSVVAWHEGEPTADPAEEAQQAIVPSGRAVYSKTAAFARDVAQAEAPEVLVAPWHEEVDALIREQQALRNPEVSVAIGAELTASDLVSLRRNREQFARRLRRPVPFKPNTYAKRGTAFHEWLEERFGSPALLDEDQLLDPEEAEVTGAELARLKGAFLASEWAERTPEFVEQEFEVVIGHRLVRGRIDAVFREPDGSWLVVDWKTGRKPTGAELQAAEIQLAVYRVAWAQLAAQKVPGERVAAERIGAAFHYVSTGETFRPGTLPDGAELVTLMEATDE